MRGLSLGLGLTAQVYAAVVSNPLVPNVMTASSFWTPSSKKTGQDTGLNGAPAMTASATLAGSGYEETAVVGTSYTPGQCITSDIDSDLKYVMFWVTGDTALCGARTLEVNFEGTTQTFDISTDAQWDSVNKRYGVPVAFRPRAGISGLGRFRAKGILANGYERVISGDLWFNYPGTTNYFDRDANAIYVSGVDLNGSGAAGTNTGTVGISGNPNDSVQRAIQYAVDTAGGREGCYVYIKGNVIDPVAPFGSRPTTTLFCEVRPWPGYAANQVQYSGPGMGAGKINYVLNRLVFESLSINTDSMLGIQTNVASEIGFRNCTMVGTVDGGDDAYGWPKCHFNQVGGVTSQEWLTYTSGADSFMENCTGTMFAPTGFRRVINCELLNGWDSFYGVQNSGGRATGWNYWWAKFTTPVGRQAKARFHSTEELAVNTVVYDSVNDWSKITWQGSPTVVANTFETHVVFLTGTSAGVEYYGGLTSNAAWPTGPNVKPNCGAIIAGSALGFPDLNTVYVKGVDLTSLVAFGDLMRVFNIPHKDAMQTNSNSDTNGFIEHGYFQNYAVVADDPQPALFQQNGFYSNAGITVSVTGTTATFTGGSITCKAGHFIQIRSGANNWKYAMVTADVTAGTTAILDSAALNGTAGAIWTLCRPVRDFVFENYLVHRTDTAGDYLMQWQSAVRNVVFLNATIIEPSAGSGMVLLRDRTAGFSARNVAFRDCLLAVVKNESVTSATTGVALDGNHYWIATTLTDAGASSGVPTFNATGSPTSGYLPTSGNVSTISRVLVPFDANGRARTVGAKRGAVVA